LYRIKKEAKAGMAEELEWLEQKHAIEIDDMRNDFRSKIHFLMLTISKS